MNTLFWIYVVGCICGLLADAITKLKVYEYCKSRKIELPKRYNTGTFVAELKNTLRCAIPIYHYLMFLVVLFYDDKKFEKIIQNQIDKT